MPNNGNPHAKERRPLYWDGAQLSMYLQDVGPTLLSDMIWWLKNINSEGQACMSAGQSILSACSVIKNQWQNENFVNSVEQDMFSKAIITQHSDYRHLSLEPAQINFEILQTFIPYFWQTLCGTTGQLVHFAPASNLPFHNNDCLCTKSSHGVEPWYKLSVSNKYGRLLIRLPWIWTNQKQLGIWLFMLFMRLDYTMAPQIMGILIKNKASEKASFNLGNQSLQRGQTVANGWHWKELIKLMIGDHWLHPFSIIYAPPWLSINLITFAETLVTHRISLFFHIWQVSPLLSCGNTHMTQLSCGDASQIRML